MNDYIFKSMQKLVDCGCKCYVFVNNDYGYIVTPNDNVLYVQHEYLGGYNFSLQYPPTWQNGTGCQCYVEPVCNINIDTVLEAERQGLEFARKLNVKLYKSSEDWLRGYWDKINIVEV